MPVYSNNGVNTNTTKHPFTTNWDYYKTKVVMPTENNSKYQMWEAVVNVKNNTDGKSYVYDITDINIKKMQPSAPSAVKSVASSSNIGVTPTTTKVKNSLPVTEADFESFSREFLTLVDPDGTLILRL